MKRTEVLERLNTLTGYQVKRVEHTPKTRYVVTPDMIVLRPGEGRHALTVTQGGAKNLARFAGLGTDLPRVLSPDTFGRAVTELMAHKRGGYTVVIKDNEAVDFGPAELAGRTNVNPERVVSLLENVMGSDAEYYRVTIENLAATLEVVGVEEAPVARGDIIRAGALVKFSPLGTILPVVQSYCLRLACTNGATTNTILREYHYGGDGGGSNFWDWFKKSVRESYRAVDTIAAEWQRLTNEAVAPADRAGVLDALIREAKLPPDMADAVRAEALAHPPENAYQVMNLITWASSHLLSDPKQITRAMTVAADFATEVERHKNCPVCHRVR